MMEAAGLFLAVQHVASQSKMVFDLLIIMALLMIYRQLSRRKMPKVNAQTYYGNEEAPEDTDTTSTGHKIQTFLHKYPGLNFMGQWYAMLYLVFFVLAVWNYYDVFVDTYKGSHMLSDESIEATMAENDPSGKYFTPERRAALAMPPWLKKLSLAAPVAALLGLLILFVHFGMDVKQVVSTHHHQKYRAKFAWLFGSRSEMVIINCAVPGIFMLMAVRSVCRMWFVMRGQHIDAAAVTDEALYVENFELAAIAQYFAVGIWSQLAVTILSDANPGPDLVLAMRWVGFQGLWGWVILGVTQSVLFFFEAYFAHHIGTFGVTQAMVDHVHNKMLPPLGVACSIASLLATYNMLVVCKLPYIEKALGNANAKFMGTKMLLLLAPNQLKLLNMFTPSGCTKLNDPRMRMACEQVGFSKERAMLIHASLLCFECLVIVIVNLVTWNFGKQSLKSFLLKEYAIDAKDTTPKTSVASNISEPLLG